MCQTIDKARVFYSEKGYVNILMALGVVAFANPARNPVLIYMQEYLGIHEVGGQSL